MKKNIAIIGASEFQNPLILKAKEKGYTTHVFAWKANDVGETTADVFHDISIVEKEAILAVCQDLDIVGICSIGSDLASVTVSYVAQAMGLTGNSVHSAQLSTNKYAMRLAFKEKGDPIPGFYEGDANTQESDFSLNYPLIVKPTDRSGSRGVTKITSPEELPDAIVAALADSFEKKVMIEEYVGGEEYSVECISHNGIHTFLALTYKHTTGAPSFIEMGHDEPAEVSPALQEKIIRVVTHALDTLEITQGASHAEIKIDKGDIRIIEIGGRMGGDCIGSHLVPTSTGYDFVGMVVDIACGGTPDFSLICTPHPVAIRFIFTPSDVAACHALMTAQPHQMVATSLPEVMGDHAITDSSTRYGFYIYKSDLED